MPRLDPDQPLLPSLLDRLIDEQPEQASELPRSRSQVLRDLKQSVRRDLQDLLNSHQRCSPVPEDLAALQVSLAGYGIPDIRSIDMATGGGRAEFRRVLEGVICRFEPRLHEVRVELLENVDPLDRLLRFRIHGVLRGDPAPEVVAFNSAMKPATGNVEVASGR
jgi:type VI secretion system protein ImpF